MICASGGQLDLVPAIAVIPGPQALEHLHGLNRSIDPDSTQTPEAMYSFQLDLIPGLPIAKLIS